MRTALLLAAPLLLVATALALAIALGGPSAPPPLASIAAPLRSVDWSALPPPSSFAARDGERLAYRAYAPAGGGARATVVLIHGSSARSESVHPLARGLARAGYAVVVPDVRGHGASGPKGRVRYIGQLEDDLEDLVRAAAPGSPRILAGFSSGGGYALRFAGGARQALFDRYVLLSPFLGPRAPTYRAGPWVGVGVPRIVALTLLNRAGVSALNGLPV
ncbi:MAG: alpha/beta hydrolase, partial [Anaeromyxobacteraceae bacterium]